MRPHEQTKLNQGKQYTLKRAPYPADADLVSPVRGLETLVCGAATPDPTRAAEDVGSCVAPG